MNAKAKVLVINSNIELMQALESWLADIGCITKSVQIFDLKTKKINFKNILLSFKPTIIIYDVSIPYDENWNFFLKITSLSITKEIKFIVTTTNKKALESLVGPTNTYEIIGKPFDIVEVENLILSKN